MTEESPPTETRLIAKIIRYVTPAMALLIMAFFAFQLPRIVAMIFLAYLLSYVFRPFIQLLEYRGFTRSSATIILFTAGGIVAGILLWAGIPMLWDQGQALQQRLAERNFTEMVQGYLREIENQLNFLPRGTLVNQVDFAYSWILDQIGRILGNIYVFLEYLIIVPFMLYFIIRDGHLFKRAMLSCVPNAFFEMSFNLFYKIDEKLGGYIRGIIFESLIIAALNIVGFWIVDVPYATIIGLFAGFCNIVPYIGPIAGGIPALVVKFVENQVFLELLPVLIVLAVVQLIDNVWAKPFVMSRSMDMHPLLIILAVVAGGKLYGVLGMVLSIPLASILVVVLGELNWAIRNYRFQA